MGEKEDQIHPQTPIAGAKPDVRVAYVGLSTDTASTPTATTTSTAKSPNNTTESVWATALMATNRKLHPSSVSTMHISPAALETIAEMLCDTHRRLMDICDSMRDWTVQAAKTAVEILFGHCNSRSDRSYLGAIRKSLQDSAANASRVGNSLTLFKV